MATDPTNASNLSSGSVPTAQLGNVDTTALEDDIAILGFKVATNGSLAKYDLVDQTQDVFEDDSGIDASASTAEIRNTNKYYSGGVAPTGATKTTFGAFDVFEITAGPFVPGTAASADILVVAGAGGGGVGDGPGGGGGAGGLVYDAAYSVLVQSYSVTIGAGGVGLSAGYTQGNDGADSVAFGMTADGGGGGSGRSGNTSQQGRDGGSGGGGGYNSNAGGSATQGDSGGGTGFGYAGGTGGPQSAGHGAAGGGGAGSVGFNGSSSVGGNGGTGKDYSGTFGTGVGDSGWFASGGGGGAFAGYTYGTASSGGGGDANGTTGNAGTANTGGGAGGCFQTEDSSAGGSGVVVLRCAANALNSITDMTLVSNATTSEAVPTKGDIVMTYTNGVGTATINTDIKAYMSRDNGTTYTQLTLADQGDTGGHTILTSHDLDISGQPSGSAMRYKITTHNQSASKETRVQAVSLGWS
jgi:hypothetical protein